MLLDLLSTTIAPSTVTRAMLRQLTPSPPSTRAAAPPIPVEVSETVRPSTVELTNTVTTAVPPHVADAAAIEPLSVSVVEQAAGPGVAGGGVTTGGRGGCVGRGGGEGRDGGGGADRLTAADAETG